MFQVTDLCGRKGREIDCPVNENGHRTVSVKFGKVCEVQENSFAV